MIIIKTDNGDIGLQPMSCILSMAINGVWVLKMEHSYDKEGRWQYITEDSVLYVDVDCLDGVSSEQQYRITLCQRSLTSIYVEAYPIALDAFNDRVFTSVVRNGATPSRLALDITSTAYPVTTNLPNTLLADYKYENTNLIAIINGGEDCFVEKYGGEIKYNNNAISINNRLDSGSTSYVYAGRDVTSLMHSVNTSDVITRIYPLSANGMRLNARGDATVAPGTPYVDSEYIDDYGVIHAEFIKTHLMLCTEDEKNADVEAFNDTMGCRSTVITAVQDWMRDLMQRETVADTKRNIEYLQSILKLTKDKNKNSGIIEGLQKAITANLTNVAFKQMVANWVKEACEEFDSIDAPEYQLYKFVTQGTDHYIYADKNNSDDRAIAEWHRLDSKWRWFSEPNGWLVEGRDNSKNWSWYADTGATVAEGQSYPKLYGCKSDGIYLQYQWEKVNGTWYWFDNYGHHLSPSARISSTVDWIVATYNAGSFGSEIVAEMERQLYEGLYQRMVMYCEDLYSKGVDRPKMEINLEAMDISQIEGYQQLQTLSLGNNVVFRNNGTTINERVVELEYDCIRKVNTRIILGMPTETISAIITRNIETNPALIAGYGVDIDGNVINIASGGGEVKGLRWWEETSNHIERQITSIPVGGWTADDPYLIQSQVEWSVYFDESPPYTNHGYKVNDQKAVGAFMHFYYSGYGRKGQAPVILSPVKEAVKLHYDGEDAFAYSNTISYGGLEWYVSCGTDNEEYPRVLDPTSIHAPNECDEWDLDYISYSGGLVEVNTVYTNFYQACIALLDIANVRTRDSYITGINAGENYPFYGGYVASGDLTPSNAPFHVDKNGNVVGKEFTAGSHRLTNKQDKLTAGQNVQIEGNTISATDTTYSAGDNITIDENNVISASGNLEAIELTRAEYNNLTPAEKSDLTKIYFVYD